MDPASYLAAIIDGEGCVSKLWMDGNVMRGFHVSISNTESDIIIATCRCLDELGIWYTVHQKGAARVEWAHSYVISIARREALAKLFDLVPLQDSGKRERLRAIVNGPRHREITQTDFFPAELVQQWYDAGLTQQEIANWLGMKRRTVSGQMARLEIRRAS